MTETSAGQAIESIKQEIAKALERLELSRFVSLSEIEQELRKFDTAFKSLLLLGILSRIIHRRDDKALKMFIPAITEWKNYLPHKGLGGLSPAEYIEKYPPGPYESHFITELIKEYWERLSAKNEREHSAQSYSREAEFDLERDFEAFQKEYFRRVPLEQPFLEDGVKIAHFMTIKDIIVEERRRAGRPEKDIDKIGLKIFVEDIVDGAGGRIEAIDEAYVSAVKELAAMQSGLGLKNRRRVHAIRKLFERQEPYHRCGPEPHRFYLNYANVVLLDGGKVESVLALLDRALEYQPDYSYALKLKRRLRAYYNLR